MVGDPEKPPQIVRFRDATVALLNTHLPKKAKVFFANRHRGLTLREFHG